MNNPGSQLAAIALALYLPLTSAADKPNILVIWGKEGIQDKDPTLARMLKDEGYVTGQFGKNHLGDRDEHLPTAHGFDAFFGILYHLNTHRCRRAKRAC